MVDQKQRETLLTAEGKQALESQLPDLVAQKREIMARLQGAKTYGDAADGGEYREAKDELANLDRRIREIEDTLRHAKLVDTTTRDGTVRIGCRVTVREDGQEGTEETWTIVFAAEASTRNRKISNQSPMGAALMGKRVGDQIRVHAPAGDIVYTITAIE